MKIKTVDLNYENDLIRRSVIKKISKLIDSSAFTLGKPVQEFEKSFARYCGVKYCLGVGSGTDALRTALLACGVGLGDEVITTPITYTSTSLAIAHCGGRPVFVDVLENGNIDHTKIEQAITKRTKAILVVHMFGNACSMSEIKKIAKKHRLRLIDDCAHSQGAKYKGKIIGSLADISCFSFYPTKNLGAWGDAGGITTDNKLLLKRAFLFKNYGEYIQNFSEVIGYNSKLDTIQAIVLGEKLKYLNSWNKKRLKLAFNYSKNLAGVGDLKIVPFSGDCSYYNFPIRTKRRTALMKFLADRNIQTLIRYPVPMHLQKCFKQLGYKKGDFPMAEEYASSVVSLPIYSSLSRDSQNFIIKSIKEFFIGADF